MFLLLLFALTSHSECRRPHDWWSSVPQFLHKVIVFSILLLSFLPFTLTLQLIPCLYCGRGLVTSPQCLGQPSDAFCSRLYTCHLAWTSDNARYHHRGSTPLIAWPRLQNLGDSSALLCIEPSNLLIPATPWTRPRAVHHGKLFSRDNDCPVAGKSGGVPCVLGRFHQPTIQRTHPGWLRGENAMFAPLHLDQPLGLGQGAQQSRIPGGCHCHRILGIPLGCPPPALPNDPERPYAQSSSKIPGQPLPTRERCRFRARGLTVQPLQGESCPASGPPNTATEAPQHRAECVGVIAGSRSSQKDPETPILKEPDFGRLSSFTLLLGGPWAIYTIIRTST